MTLKWHWLFFPILLSTSEVAAANILIGAGRDGFDIIIEQLDPEARAAKLNATSLKKVVLARIAKRNITYKPGSDAQLYVRIVVLTSRDTQGKVLGYGAHVELSFREQVFVKRLPDTFFMAPTWFKGAVTVANPQKVVTEVVSTLAGLTDQFLRDYKTANPVFVK